MTTATTRPPKMEVDADSIPTELRSLRRWVVWRWTWKPEEQKWDKPPLQVTAPTPRVTTRRPGARSMKHWRRRTTSTASASCCLIREFVGIDLDDCRNPDTGVINEPTRR